MIEQNENKDNIEQLKSSLYSRNTDAIFEKKRHILQDKNSNIAPTEWNIREEAAESSFKLPYMKILFGAVAFFVLALIFTFGKFFTGNNVVSGNNIDILVSGPVSIAGGEELPLEIEVKNNNNIDLKVVDLRIEYPVGTKSVKDQTIDMPRYSEVLGDIAIGRSEKRLVKSVLFGEENTQKIVKITVEYRVTGSNAIFSKEKDFNVLISSSPVNVKVSGPTEISSNQLTDFSIDINSNSTTVVKNLILKINYPFGFNLSSSYPKSVSADGTVFSLGDLAPGAKRNIRISGTVDGQDGEQKILKFTIGIPNKEDDKVVGTPLAMTMASVSIKRASVGLDMSVNEQSGSEIAVNAGSKNRVSVVWRNNLTDKIYDLAVKIRITGQAINKESVNVVNGFYNSSDNSITFDKSGDSLLSEIGPDSEGDMQFDFGILTPSSRSLVSFGNASIRFDITVEGNRAGIDGAATKEILYTGTKTLKISSDLRLLSRGFRTVGPFENSGPFPPQVDNETTYTITWTATDSFNNVNGVRVSAFLPPNVKWTGYTSPDTENITYDKGTGEIVWKIGDMKYGIGTNSPAKSVSFQVAITPSITQLGQEINLLNEATISGTDVFSGARIGEVKNPITTNITSDPEYVDDIGKVVR